MKKSNLLFAGEVFDLAKYSKAYNEYLMQEQLDTWLGKETVKVDLNVVNPDMVEITLHRKYGDFYTDPDKFSCINTSIMGYDKQIILGLDYAVGTKADFSTYPGRYVMYYDVKDFEQDYKDEVKSHHSTRVKGICFEQHLDWCKMTVEFQRNKPKKH